MTSTSTQTQTLTPWNQNQRPTGHRAPYRSNLEDLIDEFFGTAVPTRDRVLSVTLEMFVQFLYTKTNLDVRIDPNETWKAYTAVRDCMALGAVQIRESDTTVGGEDQRIHKELADFEAKVTDWHDDTISDAHGLNQKLNGITHAMTQFVLSKSAPPAVVSEVSHMKLVLRLIVGCLVGLTKPMSKISSALSGAAGACFGTKTTSIRPAENIANELNTAETPHAALLLLSSVPTHKNKFYLVYAACFLHFVLGIEGIAIDDRKKTALADIHFMYPVMKRNGVESHNAECARVRDTGSATLTAYSGRTLSTAAGDGSQ